MDHPPSETRLVGCPSRPSCVCSADPRPRHRIEPFRLNEPAERRFAELCEVIRELPRVELLEEDTHFLHFVFKTRVFRFADDVEFMRSDRDKVEVRSCSRVGYYDFGTNRRRIEGLRRLLRDRGIIR